MGGGAGKAKALGQPQLYSEFIHREFKASLVFLRPSKNHQEEEGVGGRLGGRERGDGKERERKGKWDRQTDRFCAYKAF